MMEQLKRNWRKLVASVLLVAPSLTLLPPCREVLLRIVRNLPGEVVEPLVSISHLVIHTDDPTRFQMFFLATFVMFILSVILAVVWGRWRANIVDFIRLFLSRAFIGELSTSLYGLLIFVFFAVILTQWLPNAFQDGNVYYAGGSILYFMMLIFMSAFVYPIPEVSSKGSKDLPPKVKYALYPLSGPGGWDLIPEIKCECLRKNALNGDDKECEPRRPPNIVPVYLSFHNQLCGEGVRLRKVFLAITDIHLRRDEKHKAAINILSDSVRDSLREFFRKVSRCMEENSCTRPKFLIRWYGSNGDPEVVGGGDYEIEVEFIHLGSGNDLMEAWRALRGNGELQRILNEESQEIVFHLTSGTAVISAALTLEAIRGYAHAEYVVQNTYNEDNLKNLLKPMDVNIFELDDLVEEIKRYFERIYLRELEKKGALREGSSQTKSSSEICYGDKED